LKHLAVFSLSLLLLLACKKENRLYFPVSEYAKTWIPSNQDSILFVDSSGTDTLYLSYNNYRSYNQPQANDVTLEELVQQGFSSDSNFIINYLLQAGVPDSDSLGRPVKTDRLSLTSTNTFNELLISNTALSGSLFYLDSLVMPDSTVVFNVLTDNRDYFMTRMNAIIQFNSGGTWYYAQ
jgi:hypothetical protein